MPLFYCTSIQKATSGTVNALFNTFLKRLHAIFSAVKHYERKCRNCGVPRIIAAEAFLLHIILVSLPCFIEIYLQFNISDFCRHFHAVIVSSGCDAQFYLHARDSMHADTAEASVLRDSQARSRFDHHRRHTHHIRMQRRAVQIILVAESRRHSLIEACCRSTYYAKRRKAKA